MPKEYFGCWNPIYVDLRTTKTASEQTSSTVARCAPRQNLSAKRSVCHRQAHAARSGTEKIIGRLSSITLTTKLGSL